MFGECLSIVEDCQQISGDPLIANNDMRIKSIMQRVALYGASPSGRPVSPTITAQLKQCARSLARIRDELYAARSNSRQLSFNL